MMTSMHSTAVKNLSAWTRSRLDEMDAAITSMEARMQTMADHAHVQAHLALLDARKWRESFRTRMKEAARIGFESATSTEQLENSWQRFEQAFERWTTATGAHAEELRARTKARAAAWDQLIARYQEELAAASAAGAERLKADFEELRKQADRQKDNLRKIEGATTTSYAAWVDALGHARQAFDAALKVTREQFTERKAG